MRVSITRLLLSAAAGIVVPLVVAASAQAWVQAGDCRLHAWPPQYQSGRGWISSARLDTCGDGYLGIHPDHQARMETCIQYYDDYSFVWRTAACHITAVFPINPEVRGDSSYWCFSPYYHFWRWRWLRTWAWASVDGHAASMTTGDVYGTG